MDHIATKFASVFSAKYSKKYLIPFLHTDLFLTENCNHRCDYCFVEGKRSHLRMSPETAQRSLEFILESSGKHKKIYVLLFGGEPLLEMPLIEYIINVSKELSKNIDKELLFSITTNGTLMTENMADKFAKWGIKYLLSIDGKKETHDHHRKIIGEKSSFDEVVKRIPIMKRYQRWLGARVTVHPNVVDKLFHNILHLFGLGINQFLISPVTGIVWENGQVDEYEEQIYQTFKWYKEMKAKNAPLRVSLFEKNIEAEFGQYKDSWGCGAGRARVCITVDGGLYGCGKLVGIDKMKETWKMGDIWNGCTNLNNRFPLMDTTCIRRLRCAKCEYKDECTGGCPAVNYQINGNIYEPDPVECKFVKAIINVKKRIQIL